MAVVEKLAVGQDVGLAVVAENQFRRRLVGDQKFMDPRLAALEGLQVALFQPHAIVHRLPCLS